MTRVEFNECFQYLTENPPFEWQASLFEEIISGQIPDCCDIPTGLGKTSIIAIWVLVLGESFLKVNVPRSIPLRLVYVVDRRVVVDQSTDEANKVIKRFNEALTSSACPAKLRQIAEAYREATFTKNESLIALSTLRGQKADNREWCLDPSHPSIIIGTVDMIGSRLLFSGYGKVGINHRSLQAGLLGQDTLVVIDEAHLSPVFVSTLLDTKCAIHQTPLLHPFHVMTLSATFGGQGKTLEIDEQKESLNDTARLRLNAKKQIEWLAFDQTAKAKEGKKALRKEIDESFAERLVNRAIEYEYEIETEPARSIVIFLQTVNMVTLIAEKLSEKLNEIAMQGKMGESIDKKERKKIHEAIEDRILKMTGEMRGAERDSNHLVESLKFKAFLPERDRKTPHPPYYLIATSCAEVGVNLDADHGLCDLSTLDSMIQRIGRINRFGLSDATITIVIDEWGLNAVESDLLKEEEHLQALSKLSAQIDELQEHLAKGRFDKTDRKDLQKQISAKKGAREKLKKAGPKYEFEKMAREDSKIYFTWRALKSKANENGKVNASPLALRGLLASNQNALPDNPVRPPFDESRLDDWAMTSLKQAEYPRPLVQYWLRGVIDDERAQTTFVWRADLDHFDFSNLSEEKSEEQLQQAQELATTIPIQPQERANIATYRAGKLLKELTKKFPDKPIVIIDPGGQERAYTGDQIKDDNNLFEKLASATAILPCCVGGLDKDGNPLDKLPKEMEPVRDVVGSEWSRYLITRHSIDQLSIKQLGEKNGEIIFYPSWQAAWKAMTVKGVCVNTKEIQRAFANEDNTATYVGCFFHRNFIDHFLREDVDDVSSLGMQMRTVDEHDADVERYVRYLAEKIGLPDEISESLAAAGFRHDLGKAREWWQKAIGNFSAEYYAKSNNNSFDHSFNQGYRHEFGSLVESLDDEDLKAHPHCDLILHLIAAHHGYARPHFPERAFDRNQPKPLNQQIAHETMLRFNHLQRLYGWWQLAYLEAILKAADAMASRDFSRGEL